MRNNRIIAMILSLVLLSACIPLQVRADLVLYWPLDDATGTTAASGVAGGNDGTLVNFEPPGWITTGLPAGLPGSTAALDSATLGGGTTGGNYVDGGNIGVTSDAVSGAATVSLWFNPRTMPSPTDDGYRLFGQSGDALSCCTAGVDPAGGTRVLDDGSISVWPGGGAWQALAPAGSVGTDAWHHLAFAWEKNQVTAYVNGLPQSTGTSNFNYDASVNPNLGFGLGRTFNGMFGANPDGAFDDVAIWSTRLADDQIALLASGTSPLDAVEPEPPLPPPAVPIVLRHYWPLDDATGTTATSGVAGGNDGILMDFDADKVNNPLPLTPGDWVSADLPPQLGHSGGALDYDKVASGFVDGGDIGLQSDASGGAATVSLWYQARTLPLGAAAGEDGDRLFSATGNVPCCNPGDPGGAVRVNEVGAIEIWPGSGGWQVVAPDGSITPGQWHHVALVWDKNVVTGFVDGVEGLTAISDFDYDASGNSALGFGLGARYRTSDQFFGRTPDGVLDDVSIWQGVLSETHIQQLAGGAPPPTVPEPNALVLLALAMLGMIVSQRSSRRIAED